jgi:hypothetical protein
MLIVSALLFDDFTEILIFYGNKDGLFTNFTIQLMKMDEIIEESEGKRQIRMKIAKMIMGGAIVAQIQTKYSNYNNKEKMFVRFIRIHFHNFYNYDHIFFDEFVDYLIDVIGNSV